MAETVRSSMERRLEKLRGSRTGKKGSITKRVDQLKIDRADVPLNCDWIAFFKFIMS